MSEMSFELGRALNKYVKNFLRAFVTIDGIVTAVNDDYTVDITIQDVVYSGVPVKVLVGSQANIYEVPVLNSACLVTFRDGNRALPQIVSFDKVDKYYIKVNNYDIQVAQNLTISAQLTQFNGGNNDGMVLLNPLVEKINNIENLLNDLIEKYNLHTHILTLTSGTGTAAPTTTTETGTITPITQPSDIENTQITQ